MQYSYWNLGLRTVQTIIYIIALKYTLNNLAAKESGGSTPRVVLVLYHTIPFATSTVVQC